MKRILIVGAAWVGDAVLAQPLFSALRATSPEVHLTVMGPRWTHGVLRRMPEVDALLDHPFPHGRLDLPGRWRLGRTLRSEGFDQAIVLPNSWKSALVPWFAKIPRRTGFIGEQRHWLLNDARRLNPERLPLMMQRFLSLANPQGQCPEPLPHPRLVMDPESQSRTLERLNLSRAHPIAILCPGAEYGPAKRWPAAHFAQVARQWMSQGWQIWILGSAKDHPVGAEIVRLVPAPVQNLCGITALEEAVDLMALAQRVVTNDSGLMHVAAALGRPLVALFGSSSPQFTPPLSAQARVLRLGLPCSPCFQRTCPLVHLNCLNLLGPEQVLASFPDPT
ncbi:ADP-heptose--LPS heptosyltransferase 2 [Ferrovum myxofaciens]|uniref:lipopolysaccharide heptosyltransferase II n=1 Tax=Ferrovum myxofaciens TaxID=416213 RepID=A0A149VZH2_9PROT|nr:lipopolysaccharide heptosyltransferase II [Ferrovum myxofaciens]KXW58620.1 ADP-heptose--LPS heptosyltransferase 2 [Ferrovum myxofaciens]NDU89111.1 lipopolysaccharide heptosyltransferase II [Ferrovum sp.]